MGFDSFWLPESHFVSLGSCPTPLLLLAAAAARTSKIALGTTSYLLPIRNPIHAAEEVAVLDRLSNGRVILGLGRGFRPALFDAFEVPLSEKRDRFEATLALMRRAWAGEPIFENGNDRVRLEPRPLQEPHPPLWVAAFGPKGLAQAGRLGLPYLASPVEPLDRLVDNYRLHAEALPDTGSNGALPVPIMRTVFVSRDHATLRRVREGLEQQAAEMRGSTSAIIRRRAEGAIDDWAVVGDPEQVKERIARYREELGMTHLVVRGAIAGADSGERLDSLETILTILR